MKIYTFGVSVLPIFENFLMYKTSFMLQWRLANDFVEDGAFLAPPQVYELTKLKKFYHSNKLEKFSRYVDSNGCQQFTPVPVKMMDGEVFLLPGKDLIFNFAFVDFFLLVDVILNFPIFV